MYPGNQICIYLYWQSRQENESMCNAVQYNSDFCENPEIKFKLNNILDNLHIGQQVGRGGEKYAHLK